MRTSITLTLSLLLLCIFMMWGMVASGQDAGILQQAHSTAQQQTVDAAVQELFRQTEQAQQTPNATQTIEAAFSAALTATNAAIPTATPAPLDVNTVEAVSSQEYDLMAGPARTSAYLAPNGEIFAHFSGLEICIYLIDGTGESCIPLWDSVIGDEVSIEPETVYWSPDSRYLVMTEDFLRRFIDSDIWVMDTQEGTLTNLTDDEYYRYRPGESDNGLIDLAPTWMPLEPSRIMFMRYALVDGEFQPGVFVTIDLEGNVLEEVISPDVATRFSVYALDVSPDEKFIAFNRFEPEDDKTALNGVWLLDRATGETRQIHSNEFVPWTLEFSPNGRFIASLDTRLLQFGAEAVPENSAVTVIDIETGEGFLIDNERYVLGMGWSPDGAGLVYLVRNLLELETSGLYITSQLGEPGRLLLQGLFSPTTSTFRQLLTWAGNDTVLLSRSPESGVIVVQLGQ